MNTLSCTNCNSTECFINLHVSKLWKKKISNDKSVDLYKRKQQIFAEGDPVKGIYFIYKGKVKVYNSDVRGRNHIIRLAGAGKILGHRGFGKITNYPIGASAIEDSTICFIQKRTFTEALNNNPQLSLELVQFFADELRRTENKLRSLSLMTVKQKLAEAILTIAEIHGTTKKAGIEFLNIILSRQEYADITGASIEEVIRTLSSLKMQGLIRIDGKNVGIVKRRELEEMLREFGPLRLP
jgi:CRP/FNR family transcriptional regulator, anaerobic regulatory protein